MVGVRNIDIGAEHIFVADFDIAARVDHHVSVKIIMTAGRDSNSVERLINGPQPAALRKRIIIPDADLGKATASSFSLHAVASAYLHSEHAIEEKPYSAGCAPRHAKKKLLD